MTGESPFSPAKLDAITGAPMTILPFSSVEMKGSPGPLSPATQTYDFYVQTGPYTGCGMVSALTTDTWTPETGNGIVTALPSNPLRLPLSSNLHSMNQTYLTR